MRDKEEFMCLVCDKEQEVLVKVQVKGDFIFCRDRGVCQECLKNKDINRVCKEFSIRKVKEQIKDCENSIKEFNKQLEEIEGEEKE